MANARRALRQGTFIREKNENEIGEENANLTERSGGASQFDVADAKGEQHQRELRDGEQKNGEKKKRGKSDRGSSQSGNGSADVPDSEVEGLERHDEHRSTISGKDEKPHTGNESGGTKIDVRNTQGTGFKSRTNGQGQEEHGGASPPGEQCEGDWSEIIAQFRGVPDGVSSELDKTRTNRLKSLGNAIVSQIAEEIGRAIIKAELRNERL